MFHCVFLDRKRIIYTALLLALYLGVNAEAQSLFRGQPLSRERSTQIHYESLVLPAARSDSLDFHFYAQIDHSLLQFVLDTQGQYHASYEITAAILSEKRTVISNQIRLGTANDIQNLDNDKKITSETEYFHFRMPNTAFTLYLELFDRETRRSLYSEYKITPPFFSSFVLSDIFYFHQTDDTAVEPATLRPVQPVSRNEIDTTLKSVIFIAAKDLDKSVSLHRSLLTSDGKHLIDDTTDVYLRSLVQPVLIPLPAKLDFGSYQLRVELLNTAVPQIKQRTFFVKWGEMNSWMPDLPLAIESLVHVTNESEINKVLAKSREEQEIWLQDFWKSRDPDKGSTQNPLQAEYYQRVSTSNKQFSSPGSDHPGWKTDRGYVYIVYGAPTDVDRPQPGFGESSRYEIWFYRTIQRRFVFLDKFGSGDYRLVSQE